MLSLMDMAIFGGIAIVVILLGWLALGSSGNSKLSKRVAKLRDRKAKSSSSFDASTLRRKKQEASIPFVRILINKLPRLSMLSDRLERAGVKMTAEKYILINVGIVVLVTLLFWLATGRPPYIGLFLGIALGIGLPHFAVNIIIGSELKKFIQLFPEAIDLIVRGLRSGLPVTESMTTVATEVSAPLGPTFLHITDQVKLGVPLEKALQDTAKRMNCTEFNFFVTSLILQRETGGNLSEILNNLSDVLRKRVMMKLKIKAMSSEARASAMIVGALPFVVTAILAFVSPNYLAPLINDYRGNVSIGVALCMMGFGTFIMYKMTQFDI